MVALFPCLANFLLLPSRPQIHSSASCGLLSPACRTALAARCRLCRHPWRYAPPHLFTCGRPLCRRDWRRPIAAPTASGSPATNTSWWMSAALRRRSRWTASSHISGRPRSRRLRPLVKAGLPCRVAADPSSPLPCTRLGGGSVEAINTAPSTGEIRQYLVVNLRMC
jgi:hypothetical protein